MAIKKKRVSKPKTRKKRVSKLPKPKKRTSRKPSSRKPKAVAQAFDSALARSKERAALVGGYAIKTRATEHDDRPASKRDAVEFSDPEDVRVEMARALGVEPESLEIEEYPHSISGTSMYRVDHKGVMGDYGRHEDREYYVVENNDAAEDEALARVKQDLENEPEIFEQHFIEQHIDTERLRRDLHSDVENQNREYVNDLSDSEFWGEAGRQGMTVPDDDEDGNTPEPTDSDREDLAERITDEKLKDPMEYLEDIYGKEDAVKQAIQIAGIDVDGAAQEAVNVDGAGHFLASYDGNLNETPNGLAYWRHN